MAATLHSVSSPATLHTVQPGGDDPDQFNVREAWYPIAYLQDLDPQRPFRFTLIDQDLVIWWDPLAKTWRAFQDECPHRLVPLSEGRVNEQGWLECPYHGWAFSGTGQCEVIPQTESREAVASQRACVRAFPTAAMQGLLFVYAGQAERAAQTPVPIIEAMTETPEAWVCLNTFRDLPYDAFTLLENVLDSSHIPFTHHQTIGKRENAAPMALELKEANRQGFVGYWAEGPRKGKLGSQLTHFVAPHLMWHDLTSQQFGRTLTVVYATPTGRGQCRMFARFPFKFPSKLPGMIMKLTPQWYSHRSQNRILEDDQIFLHYQERSLAKAGGNPAFAKAFYLATPADRYVQGFHEWQRQYCLNPLSDRLFPDAQSPEKLLDRYHSHTLHCASCRGALKRFQQIKTIALAIAIVSAASLPLLLLGNGQLLGLLYSLVSIGILAGAAIAAWIEHYIQGFYQGPRIPPRNQGS